MKLLQIVPGFGNAQNGLTDYAKVLENELLKMNISSFYDPQQANDADAILLNYSGYGYQKRGIPFQLYFKMKSLTKRRDIPLFIYFHEVYAGKENILTSSYWLHSVQKMLYKKLYKLSTSAFCGNDVIFKIIKSENKDSSKLYLAPLFSNIPVVNGFPSFEERKEIAVVFGSPGRREAVYKNAEQIQMCCQRLGISEIIDIGDGYRREWTLALRIPIVEKGKIKADEVAQWLIKSKYGFISYPENIFGKSGIFAAYAGNGIIIINFPNENQSPREGLRRGIHYLNDSDVMRNIGIDYANISNNIFLWYQPRAVANHSKIIADVIDRETRKRILPVR